MLREQWVPSGVGARCKAGENLERVRWRLWCTSELMAVRSWWSLEREGEVDSKRELSIEDESCDGSMKGAEPTKAGNVTIVAGGAVLCIKGWPWAVLQRGWQLGEVLYQGMVVNPFVLLLNAHQGQQRARQQ